MAGPEGRPSRLRGRLILALAVAIPVLMSGGLLGMTTTGTAPLPSVWWLVAQAALAGAGAAAGIGMLLPDSRIGSASSTRLPIVAERLRQIVERSRETIRRQTATIDQLRETVARLERESVSLVGSSQALVGRVEESVRLTASGNERAEVARRRVAGAGEQLQRVTAEIGRLDRRGDEVELIMTYMGHLANEMRGLDVDDQLDGPRSEAQIQQIRLVAKELRGLGELAVEALRDINTRIHEIRATCSVSHDAADVGRREVETALASFDELESGLRQMRSWAEESTDVVQRIEATVSRQSDALHEVFETMGGLDQDLTESGGYTYELDSAVDDLLHADERELVGVGAR